MENKKYIIHVIENRKEFVKEHLQNARKLLKASLDLEQFDNLSALVFQLNEIDKIVKKLEIEIHSMEFVLEELEEN